MLESYFNWPLIQPHSKGILLRTFYRPPDGSDFLDVEFMSSFENVLEVANAEMKEVTVMGDLTCNFLPGARCQGETRKLQSILQSMNMTQVVKESQGNPKLFLTLFVLLNHRILPQSGWLIQRLVIMT